jgi:hypothetical protein
VRSNPLLLTTSLLVPIKEKSNYYYSYCLENVDETGHSGIRDG